MEGRRRLRMRAARLLAAMYVMFVVMSGMAIPGVDGKYHPLITAKAANTLVTIGNSEALRKEVNGAGCTVTASSMALGEKVTTFKIDKRYSTNASDGQFNIYSVKYNGVEYYYDSTKAYDGTTAGLYYSDGWKFVFPSAPTANVTIEVQLTVFLYMSKGTLNLYKTDYTSSAVGGYENISKDLVDSALDSKLTLQYYNYSGELTSGAYSAGLTAPTGKKFGYSNVRFYCAAKETDRYVYDIRYGEDHFMYNSTIHDLLQIWTIQEGKASAYRKTGTNLLVVDSNIANAENYIQLTAYWASQNEAYTGKYAAPLDYNNGTFAGTKIVFPEEGIYIPGTTTSSGYNYYGAGIIAAGNTQGQGDVITNLPMKWKGPKTSTLGTLEAGTSKNITDSLKDVSKAAADYAGNVIKVGSTVVTENTPYNDEFVSIDYYGNVTSKKAAGSQKTYKLTTETKYNKMTTKESGSYTYIGYADANGNYSTTPTGIYGTQNWTVTLTVTPTASETEATTTTEPTTMAPTTYKATLATGNSQTTIASGSQSGKGNNASISLEAGQTVTVTPGASTYGCTVTVDDSATAVTKNNNGTYSFTMPAKAVKVTVTDITLSSISAVITGAGKTAASPYAFGAKSNQPTNTEICNAFKESNLSITGTLSNNSTTSIEVNKAGCSVANNTLGTTTVSGNNVIHPGTATITVTYGGKTTTVTYYYTYTTTNVKTLNSISIVAKSSSTLSTNSASPTTFATKSELPTEAVLKSQITQLTASYRDSLGNTSQEQLASTAAGVSLSVVTKEQNVTSSNGVYTHKYVSSVTASYNSKTSNTVNFYYQYQNYSVTCNTVDEEGNAISSVKASVSSLTDVSKGTSVTISAPEDSSYSYLRTNVAVVGNTSKKTYNVSNMAFTMADEPVTVTVTYTKLSGFTVTPPTNLKLSTAPNQSTLTSLLSGASLTPQYQSAKGSKIDLTNSLVTVTLGSTSAPNVSQGVSTYTVPVTVEFKGIKKDNAFSFTYEVKNTYTANVIQTAGPNVQIKKEGGAYTGSVSGYYKDTITVKVPEETGEYAFPTVIVTAEDKTTIKTISQPGEVTFTMPAANVTVTASYQKITELKVTAPDTSTGSYSKDTTKADLPLGSIQAVYGSSSNTKTIAMTTDMYTIGAAKETEKTNADGGKTITTTVPVTISVTYGGITKNDVSFTYSYSYTVSKESKSISIDSVTCGAEQLDTQKLVNVSQSVADPNSEITVTLKETPEYAFPTVCVVNESTKEETVLTSTGTGNEKTATFVMPAADVKIKVDYEAITDIALTEPDKKQYDSYTKAEDLDLTGGSLTVSYGATGGHSKTISLKTQSGVSNGCTITCTKGAASEKDGVLVTPVTVTISYGGKTTSYEYTYEEVRSYSITLNEAALPQDFVNKEQVKLSTTIGNYNDKLTLSLPADTDDRYAFPIVTIKRGESVEEWKAKDGIYETLITDDMIVSVSYCKLEALKMTLPEGGTIGDALVPIGNLDTTGVKLSLVYYDANKQEKGRRTISTSEYASFAYGEETESVTDGTALHTVPVLVTANYKDLVTAEDSYSYQYRNYVVAAQDADGNSLSVDKNRANAGDTISVALTQGLDVQKITAKNNIVGYELSSDKKRAEIVLTEAMKTTNKGYVFVVTYKKIQKVEAPEEAVLVSDKVMTEEECQKALSDLSSFDFGTASIVVSYDEFGTDTALIKLNSPSVKKELLEDKTTKKDSADGTYTEYTYIIKATVDGESVEVPIILKVEKKSLTSGDASGNASGDASGDGTGQQTGGKNPDVASGDGNKKAEDDKKIVTSTKPSKVSGVKVTSKKRKLTVTWKAASNATAYEIWVSTKKNSGYLKAATVKKSGSKKTYSYTIKKLDDSKLKKGKTYYVKVRAINVKSKLKKKTLTQTVKSKRNRRLYVTVKSVKNAVSYTVKASTKKKGGYKTIFKFDEIGKKKYTKYIKHQKRRTKYYIKIEVKVETGKRYEGAYSSVVKQKCK